MYLHILLFSGIPEYQQLAYVHKYKMTMHKR